MSSGRRPPRDQVHHREVRHVHEAPAQAVGQARQPVDDDHRRRPAAPPRRSPCRRRRAPAREAPSDRMGRARHDPRARRREGAAPPAPGRARAPGRRRNCRSGFRGRSSAAAPARRAEVVGDLLAAGCRAGRRPRAGPGRAPCRRRKAARSSAGRTRSTSGCPTKVDGHARLPVERLLEREDHQHPGDRLPDGAHASPPPGPDLRRDVVDDGNAAAAQLARQAQVEVGVVDEHGDVGRAASTSASTCRKMRAQAAQVRDDLAAGPRPRGRARARRGAPPGSAAGLRPGRRPRGRATRAPEMADQLGAVEIARGLAAGDEEAGHRRGAASIDRRCPPGAAPVSCRRADSGRRRSRHRGNTMIGDGIAARDRCASARAHRLHPRRCSKEAAMTGRAVSGRGAGPGRGSSPRRSDKAREPRRLDLVRGSAAGSRGTMLVVVSSSSSAVRRRLARSVLVLDGPTPASDLLVQRLSTPTPAQRRHPRAGTGTGRLPGTTTTTTATATVAYYFGYPALLLRARLPRGTSRRLPAGPYGSRLRRIGDSRLAARARGAREDRRSTWTATTRAIVDDFDGIFQRLNLSPGRHEITLKLDGYRTHHFRVYVPVDQTLKLHHDMVRGAGEDERRRRGRRRASERGPAERDGRRTTTARTTRRDDDAAPRHPGAARGRLRLDVSPPTPRSTWTASSAAPRATMDGRRCCRRAATASRSCGPGYRTVEREIEVRPGPRRRTCGPTSTVRPVASPR